MTLTIFFENAPILESLRDGLLLAKQVAGVEVGLVLAHLGTRRISRVRMKRMMRMRMIMRMKRMVTRIGVWMRNLGWSLPTW